MIYSTLTSRVRHWQSLYEKVLVAPGVGKREGVLALVVNEAVTLVAGGAAERDLLDILSSDEAKAPALLPLEVALKMRLGVDVAVPAEVEEVATDIRNRIEDEARKSNSRNARGLLLHFGDEDGPVGLPRPRSSSGEGARRCDRKAEPWAK